MPDHASLEQRRLRYIADRDGPAAAEEFARRTYVQYRQALRTNYGRAYRRELTESCLVFRRYLRDSLR